MKSNEEYKNSIDQKANIIIRKRKQRNRFITTTTSVVVCLVLIVCAATVLPSIINDDSLMENPDSSHVNPTEPKQETNHRRPFSGFILTAYAANEEGGSITANFMSEATSIILQPNVDVLLGAYSPLMSSVPGLPFRFNTEDDCEIEVSVDTGILCRWDIQNGIVTQCGKTTSCAKGEILYWSPLTENKEPIENAVITVTATDKGKTVAEQTISIISNNFIYSACIDELKII